MKLKGKLILSCTALAAVATTAFSTTYAWYTANSTVTATGISASTAQAASDALQISLDGTTWGASVDLTNKLNGKTALTPVERTAVENSVGTYKIWDGENSAVSATEGVAGTNYVQFDLYFRNVGVASSNVQISAAVVSNNTKVTSGESTVAGLPGQKTLADIDEYTANDNPTYTVDLLRALDLEIATQTITVPDKDGKAQPVIIGNIGSNTWTALATKSYSLHNFHNSANDSAYKDTLDNSKADGYNAHTYYNAVKGASIDTTAAKQEDTSFAPASDALIKLADTTDKTIVKTTWTIYLNGWDKACFDACKGQTISMSLTFNAVTPQSNG